jgi:membrane protein
MMILSPGVSESIRGMHKLWQRFDRHQVLLRASALSFDTTLGVVPLLALVFVGLKLAGIQNLLGPFLLNQLAGDYRDAGTRILEYVDHVQVGSLGFFGLAALLTSLFFLLENVSDAFNAIWDIREQRSLLRRCINYLALICAALLLLTAAFGMTSLFQSQTMVQWLILNSPISKELLLMLKVTPFLCIALVLMLAYLLLPAAKVRFSSALVGGLLSGVVWQVAHWAYFRFQFGVARYNAMYGALALLPFLLIWIYTSWLLVLLGFELVRCHQQCGLNADELLPQER